MDYEITLLTTMSISILFALGLNFVTGFCGQISLGHAAFLGTGAYTSALMTKASIPFLITLPASAMTAGCLGFFIGLASLRVRHDFLAITTMGVGFLFVGIVRQQDFFGGEEGISGISSPGFSRFGFLLLCIALTLLFAFFSTAIKRSWMGRVFESIADDEDITSILGINVAHYKIFAFVVGTSVAGVAGALYAHHLRFIGPDSFGFVESVSVLAMVIIGGVGSVWAVSFSAALLSVLPMLIQFVDDYKLLFYSGLLFSMMRFSPGGMASIVKKMKTNNEKSS
ncbi:branched-chain amino acid ABC transporter permease [Bacteriovoracales bacterium]|nr:branched-chain amino acid ABC transporter permease [Bacteriovoracales bacterium]